MTDVQPVGLKSVIGFKSYRQYLQHFVTYRKQSGQYSLTRFAKDIGFQSSNYMSLILASKRNLTQLDALKIAKFLKLTEDETKYSLLLVLFEDAKEASEKRFYKAWLTEFTAKSKQDKAVLRPVDFPDFLDEASLPAILACLDTEMGCSIEKIVQLTGFERSFVYHTLQRLLDRKLVRFAEEFYYLQQSQMFDAQFGSHFRFKDFQTHQIRQALKALENHGTNGAKFAANVYLLNPDQITELHSKIKNVLHSVNVNAPEHSDSKLVQLNVQCFDFKIR